MILVEIINLYKKQTELINLSSVCPQSETPAYTGASYTLDSYYTHYINNS